MRASDLDTSEPSRNRERKSIGLVCNEGSGDFTAELPMVWHRHRCLWMWSLLTYQAPVTANCSACAISRHFVYFPKGDRTFQYRCMQPFNSDKGTTCRLSQGMSTWSKLIKTLQPGDIQLSICLSTIYSTYKFVCLHLYFFPMAYRVCDAAKLHLICGHTGITSYNNHVRHYLLPGSFHKLPWSALQSHRCRQRWR